MQESPRLPDPAQARISVRRQDRMVPLLPAAQGAAQVAAQPWRGLLLERHHVQPSEIPQHEHLDLCLHLQRTGTDNFEWWSDGHNAVEQTRPGSMILIPPGTSDRLRWSGPSERLIVSVEPEFLAKLASEAGSDRPAEFEARWALQDPAVAHLIEEMAREAAEGFPLGALYAELLASGLATQLLRRHAVSPVQVKTPGGGLSRARLRHAMEYMQARLPEDLRLEQVAQELNLSPFHFAHEFRNSTGQTPYQYLLEQRMRRAQHLLRSTDWSVEYIASESGFQSPASFVRAFRQRTGLPPGAWRKAAR